MNVVFDLGNVVLKWDPRFLYTQYFDSEEDMEWFLAHVCNSAWNLEQDRGRSFAYAVQELVKEFPEHAAAILAYDTRWHETLPHAIDATVAILDDLNAVDTPLIHLDHMGHQCGNCIDNNEAIWCCPANRLAEFAERKDHSG